MKPEIKFEDWIKLKMVVGEVAEIDRNSIKIFDNDKYYNFNGKLNVKKGDKIIIGLLNENIIIPVVNKEIPLIPEKDIEIGSGVS